MSDLTPAAGPRPPGGETTGRRRAWTAAYAAVPVVLSALVYYPVTRNYFYADDFQHLYAVADGRALEFLVTPHAGHMLVARNALFLANWAVFGTDPRGYLWGALLTHLLNVALLFHLVDTLTGSRRLACFGAVLWGTSPLNEAALGWYSVYGQVLLTSIALWVLLGMTRVAAGQRPSRRAVISWYALLLAGSTCFGTGVGVAMAAPACVFLLLPGRRNRFAHWLVASLLLTVPGLYVLVHGLYVVATGHVHESLSMAGGLTGGGAFAVAVTVLRMAVDLAAFGAARPLAGYFGPAWPYPGVALYALAAAYWLVVGAGLWRATDPRRRQLLAVLALAAGSLGIIALGRGPLEALAKQLSLPLTALAVSARYYYLPTALLIAAGCLALDRLGERVPGRWAAAFLALWLGASAAAFARHPLVIDHHDDSQRQVALMQQLVRRAAGSTPPGRPAFVHNRSVLPIAYLTKGDAFPGWAALFVVFFDDNQVDGRQVQFIEGDAEVVATLRRRTHTRTASLLVTRDEFRRAAGLPPNTGE